MKMRNGNKLPSKQYVIKTLFYVETSFRRKLRFKYTVRFQGRQMN